MTDLVVAVRLKADGSGFVGQVRLGKAEVEGLGAASVTAGAQARQLAAGTDQAARSATELAGAERQASSAATALAQDQRQLGQALAGTGREVDQLAVAQKRLEVAAMNLAAAQIRAASVAEGSADQQARAARAVASAEANLAAAHIRVADGQRRVSEAQSRMNAASGEHVRSIGQQRAGMVSFGQNLQDVGIQIGMGTDLMRVMAMQGGQLAFSLDQMGLKGAGGRVASFFAGPWGAAILAAGAILLPFIADLWETDKAQKAVELGANSLGEAQGVLGQMFDLQTGKIKNNTEALILNAQAMALNLRAKAAEQADSSSKAFAKTGAPSTFWTGVGAAGAVAGVPQITDWAMEGNVTARNLGRLARDANKITDEKARAARFRELLQISEGFDFKGSAVSKTEYQQAIVDAASSRANTAIADLIEKSLNDGQLASGLRRDGNKKKPPKPKSTAGRDEFGRDAADRIASITDRYDGTAPAARQAQRDLRQLDDLIEDLERRKPPSFKSLIADAERAKDVVRDGLVQPYEEFIAAQEEQVRIQRLINEGRVEEAEALRVSLSLEKAGTPLTDDRRKAIRGVIEELRGEQRETERLRASQQKYLNALSDTRGMITGIIADPRQLTQAPGQIFDTFKQLSAEYLFEKMFGDVFEQLQDEITGNGAIQRSAAKTSGALDGVVDAANRASSALHNLADPEVVTVVGQRKDEVTPRSFYERMLGQIGKVVGIDEKTAEKIGKFTGKGLQGAFEGQLASGVASMLGIKQSNTGAAIGGALGSFLPIPGGSIIGGLLGGTIGGLFRKAPSASAVITDGKASVSGNNAEARSSVGAVADTVANSVKRIAEALGAEVGSYSVSIGKREDHYRVSGDGSSRVSEKHPNVPLLYNGTDYEQALRAAIANAVQDGGVVGLSAAVKKALGSSTDIDAALNEAQKVAALERMLGGMTGQLEQVFKTFDRTAAERVRIAKQYGFDLLEVERINAKERADLLDETLKSRVGQLQDLLKNLQYGDLFEGTAAERRQKILAEIEDAKADQQAGDEGANDRLAQLWRQLTETSREAFGTAGDEYKGDRSSAIEDVQRVIKIETDRIKAASEAQAKQAAAIEAGNALTNETNDLLGVGNARLDAIVQQLGRMGGSTPSYYDQADYRLTQRAAIE